VIINFDIPDTESIKGSYLQKTLLSLEKVAKNLANWFGTLRHLRMLPIDEVPLLRLGVRNGVHEADAYRFLHKVRLLRRPGFRAILPLAQSAEPAAAEAPAAKTAAAGRIEAVN
jgi:hypothetical protein